jgi:hypothetical protein
MPPFRRLAAIAGAALLLGGCNAWQNRTEFAPPQSRWPTTLSGAVAADAPPPPVAPQYCYRTLAAVDCFAEPKPERITGYMGTYPDPDSLRH